MQRFAVLPLAAAFTTALSAQNYTVLPRFAASTEASSFTHVPWFWPTARYQQVHGGLRYRALSIREISWRRDGQNSSHTTAVARTLDMEMKMAKSDFAVASATFANNFTGPTTQIVNRKMINFPDFTQSQGSPAPWGIVIPFDTPFVHTGTDDLVWEVLIHSITSTGPYYLDAYQGTILMPTNPGVTASYGTGCTATGRTQPMTLGGNIAGVRASNTIMLLLTSSNGIANAPTALFVGAANPNLAVPGLCARLLSDLGIMLGGTANAAGTFAPAAFQIGFDLSLVNRQMFCQAACADTGQPGLPFALSQGLEATVPDLFVRVRRIWAENVNASSGSIETTYEFGLVTRLTHQ